MEPQLTPIEIDQKRELLKDYSPAQNAIATVVVLYILKIGLNVFCECKSRPRWSHYKDSQFLTGAFK